MSQAAESFCARMQDTNNITKSCFYGEKDVSNSRGVLHLARNETDAAGILEVLHV